MARKELLRTQPHAHIHTLKNSTYHKLFFLLLPKSTTSYLVRDLRIPPPNRDSHRLSKRKAKMWLPPKDEWPPVSSCHCLLGECQCLTLSCFVHKMTRALEKSVWHHSNTKVLLVMRDHRSHTTDLSSLHGWAPLLSFSNHSCSDFWVSHVVSSWVMLIFCSDRGVIDALRTFFRREIKQRLAKPTTLPMKIKCPHHSPCVRNWQLEAEYLLRPRKEHQCVCLKKAPHATEGHWNRKWHTTQHHNSEWHLLHSKYTTTQHLFSKMWK